MIKTYGLGMNVKNCDFKKEPNIFVPQNDEYNKKPEREKRSDKIFVLEKIERKLIN